MGEVIETDELLKGDHFELVGRKIVQSGADLGT